MTIEPVHRSGGDERREPRQLLDPELAAMQVLLPHFDVSDVEGARMTEKRLTIELQSTEDDGGVDIADFEIDRADGSSIAIRSYRPSGVTGPLPALMFLHGGSFVTGGLHTEDTRCSFYSTQAGCAVFAVDYRLAPEHPFPGGLDDCTAALDFVQQNAQGLSVDGSHVAVGGLSAGGALACGIAARSSTGEYPNLVLQLLVFPVLDASLSTYSAQHFDDTPVLNAGALREMWRLYLGGDWAPHRSTYPADSSPAHHDHLDRSPPTFICTASLDPLRDEALEYAQRLLRAGVPVDLRHYARGFHSFDSFHFTRLGRQALADQVEALRAAFS